MSAVDQLERLLYLLPRAARPEGANIHDVARTLGVAPETILADIEEATARVFYHPAGMVDALNLSVEGDVVRLYGREFDRPVRLSPAEAMALGLGLRVLAAESGERAPQILALAQQLEHDLVTPTIELQPLSQGRVRAETPAVTVDLGEDDFRGELADAIEARVYCDVVYLKPGASAPESRRIAPLRLLLARGRWYVRAADAETGALRRYRLDRILELHTTKELHDRHDDADASAFDTEHGEKVSVRYSHTVARWIAERENLQCEADGTLVVSYDVADPSWLVRHVLQYGGEAVVETPAARTLVAQAARRLLD